MSFSNDHNLPLWKCHKEVKAAKILEIKEIDSLLTVIVCGQKPNEQITVPNSYIEKHKPYVGGYFVLYEEGYMSFSPAETFESGYCRI